MTRQESQSNLYRNTAWLVFALFMAFIGWTTAALMSSGEPEKAPVERRLDDWHIPIGIDLDKLEAENRADQRHADARELQKKKLELIDRAIAILEKLEK